MDRRLYNHPASANFFSGDFIAGYRTNDRMSVVRRFFCLFVTFDLIFVTLLWMISIVINGENLVKLVQEQIVNYTMDKSLFDVVCCAAARFIFLIFFYAILQINHWWIVSITTSGSCAFLIAKVFLYAWPQNQQPFQVLLIIISFVITWFEAWFLDSRMIPQEEYSRYLTQAFYPSARESTPLLAPFLQSVYRESMRMPPESYRQSFYSPAESVIPENEEDEQLSQIGVETVIKAFELLESSDWKVEKVTASNDTIYSSSRPIGKVYKIKAHICYPAAKLLFELYYNIEDFPRWNPTLLESKILKTIDSNTDISYSVSTSGGGGIVKSRDFVNLRCWKLINNAKVVEDFDIHASLSMIGNEQSKKCETLVEEVVQTENEKPLKKASSEVQIKESESIESVNQLSKSLGAFHQISEDEDSFSDAETSAEASQLLDDSKSVYISAAMSIDYEQAPPSSKFIRGDNLISCWAMRPLAEDDSCTFEWILCIDLKGSLPKYVLNTAFVSLMTDYMVHLRSHVESLKKQATES